MFKVSEKYLIIMYVKFNIIDATSILYFSSRSVPWNGEVNIPYPSLSPTENPYETDSPSNRTTGSNKSAQQAHVQLTKLVKERSLPDASNTFIPEIGEFSVFCL